MRSLALLCLFLAAACGPTSNGGGADDDLPDDDQPGDDDQVPEIDARSWIDAPPMPDAPIAYPDAHPYDGGTCSDWECDNPVNDGCNPGGGDACNNGTDEDCDGKVDEGCGCQSGAVQSCFLGPPGRRGVGACVDGQQRCTGSGEFTQWGPCEGGIRPTDEACDSVDNDCNGCADDNPSCCTVDLACPTSMPDGVPFVDYVIDGTQFYGGAVQTWEWTVTGGPCDQLFVSIGQQPSYTLTGQNTSQLTLRPTLSGDYTVHVRMTLPDGTVYECTFIVHIAGPGLRVELCWDTAGDTDIDLHVHKPGTTTPWFALANGNNNTDDCYYNNCTPEDAPGVNWGYAGTPVAQCDPTGVLGWVGTCRNPRLDVDNISLESRPENTNIDIPENAKTYRVMVHYWGGLDMTTHPLVNIYCGGHLRATYGAAPDVVGNYNHGDGYNAGLMWRVADVTPAVANGDTTDCTLAPLHPPGQQTGYWVTNNVNSY